MPSSRSPRHKGSVFINAPFDARYQPLFRALVFAIYDCGYQPRCALEIQDAGEPRIAKIVRLIQECDQGIHDISRTEPDRHTGLPRFNMPFELGLFLGAKWFAPPARRPRRCLILDKERYRYQQFLSDIAGQDISGHGNDPEQVIRAVRNWLRNAAPGVSIPSGTVIWRRYQKFQRDLPELCRRLQQRQSDLEFNDYTLLISEWLARYA